MMSRHLTAGSAAVLAPRRSYSWLFPWRALLHNAADVVRTWLARRQQRQELLDYMAADHRATSDIGISDNDARDFVERPFWRA